MLSPELLKQIQRITIKSRYLANDLFSGEYMTAFRGRGMEFEEVREYTSDDDVRSIDWNVSARMQKPYVKVFHEEREQTVMLLVDASASESFGSLGRLKKDVVAEIAAVLTYAAVNNNDKVGLIIFSDQVEHYIPPKKGRGHVWHIVQEIMSFKPRGKKTDFNEAFHFFSHVIHRRSICFVISDFLTDDYISPLKVARFKHDVVGLMIVDPLERSFPTGGLISFKDLETDSLLTIDLTSQKIRDHFLTSQQECFIKKIRHFRSINIDALVLQTDEDYIEPLLRFFRMREKRI